MGSTLFDKIWDAHVVKEIKDGPSVLYIDKHLIHEVTSPQAFGGIEKRGVPVFRPERTVATPDHNIPTIDQHLTIKDQLSKFQVDKLTENCERHGITLYGINHPYQGIVHVVGPQMGITQPGMTIVCGDSHTSTHGAFGSIAFGIGTSEVEMVLATQCIMQPKPKKMKITVNGDLHKSVTAKDLILYIISKISASGGTGYFVEYAGSAFTSLSMEGRMTVCNMSIEMGARGGLIAPDEKTFEYIKGREFAPKGADWDKAVAKWKQLYSDTDAKFDKELTYDASDIEPMITYGTNPGMGAKIKSHIPKLDEMPASERLSFEKSMKYMGFNAGDELQGKPIDYVFVGSCTNGRIEDLRAVAEFVKGKKKADNITAWIVPGSKMVEKMAIEEGIVATLEAAGFKMRQPGCSACLAMNDDKIPSGKYAVSTSNRNFEGRQGPGSRTLLASPLTAAAVAVTGHLVDPREVM
ncbi:MULTISPECIES: 3-isopropylmalate dehydratase large subunit [unclassified Imperialibacter]|uniref:3-isopropylmalate dehydratase large subunit n=1 Tax=unclassified Imperialibacter TaxID=2629706 RepID=UPI00125AAA21|nr:MULTISPECIES: 3-isopropylmalate dehydratase large subunit [unclassified Imperialibacter]CAD5254370.1 3-isopropylmalate isomerase subunit, dehydratase component [Imperialibacter sp. 89]CAD5267281.1 3-isopropylmalate isomerase subunit, dehydratase component [Imperialibacter sp. 75]VVT00833.1 3-isopropylmalate isomerase subunit, dehydratase component [Imperialibacter sp. EC-SDR9]